MTVHDDAADPFVMRIVAWAAAQPAVRAVLLTGSRADPEAAPDAVSDYDVVLAADPGESYAGDDAWLAFLGEPVVRYHDELQHLGYARHMRLVQYADGTKVDFSIVPVALLRAAIAEGRLPDDLDSGYRVLVDKDGVAGALPPPTRQAHRVERPTEERFLATVEEFWWESGYVGRSLWRGDLLAARYSLEVVMRHLLLVRMLEWSAAHERDWDLRARDGGRGLYASLDTATAAELEAILTGAGLAETWEALARTAALFRRVASAVALALGFTYPWEMDRKMTAYLEDLQRRAGQRR